jgi:uncharacterized coiled-coil DUF342 family protein
LSAKERSSSRENLKNRARVDALDVKIGDLKDRVSELEGVSEKVKKMKGISGTISGLHKRVDGLEKDWKWVFKNLGKAESELSDLKGKVLDNEKLSERFELNEDSMHELMKVLDDIDSKLEAAVTEKRVNSAFEELMAMIHGVKHDVETRVNELSGIVDEVRESVRRTEPHIDKTDIFKRMFVSRKEFEGLRGDLDGMEGDRKDGLEKRFVELVREAEKHIQNGRVEAARMVYGDALGVYNKIASGRSSEEMAGFLDKMNSLYSQLRD